MMMNTSSAGVVTTTTTTGAMTNAKNKNYTTFSPEKDETETETEEAAAAAEQLSNDLALFLSNPTLQVALADGSLDLTSYSTTIEQELEELETKCIAVYRSKESEIQLLKEELKECDTIVCRLQEMLLGFQADLSGLSGEIRTLQQNSKQLAIQLSNRHRATSGVSTFLSKILLTPPVVQTLTSGPVGNQQYVQCVQEFQQIYNNVVVPSSSSSSSLSLSNSKQPPPEQQQPPEDEEQQQVLPSETVAGKEMLQYVQELQFVLVKRIRDYFLKQMEYLRKHPQTNVRMIQVHGLLQYAKLQDFLCDACPQIANEIYNVYVESMSKTLFSLFRTYQLQLLQLDCTRISATRQDVIAIDDASLRDSLTTKAKKRVDVFCLGSRAKDVLVFHENDSSSANSHNKEKHKTHLPSQQQHHQHHHQQQHQRYSSSYRTPVKQQQQQQQQQPRRSYIPTSSAQLHNNASWNDANANAGTTTNASSTATITNTTTTLQPILAHVAIREKRVYPYERLYKSLMGHLVEAVTNEYVFCRQFFKCDAFGPLFHGTLSLLLEQLENYLFHCYDMVACLLMIKITHGFSRMLRQQRNIHSLDGFFQQILQLLWPRCKSIMDIHKRSIKQATAQKLGGVDLHAHYCSRRFAEFVCSILLILNKTTTTTTTGDGMDPQQQQQQQQQRNTTASPPKNTSSNTTNPPTSTTEKSAGDMLLKDLNEMVDDFIQLLERLAEEHKNMHHHYPPNQQSSSLSTSSTTSTLSASMHAIHADNPSLVASPTKKKIIFLINNLDHIVCIFQERQVVGKEFNRLVLLLMKYREMFVEEELLSVGFSKLIAFVQQTEAYMMMNNNNTNTTTTTDTTGTTTTTATTTTSEGGMTNLNMDVVQSLVYDFKQTWRQHIEQMNKNVLSYFSNFRNGMELLKQVLTQLLLYYTRFQDIIRKVWGRNPNNLPTFCKDLVNTQLILSEIKKYALAI